MMTPEESKRQREFRNKTGNAITKRYEKTINGYLMRTYRNMKSRVKGILKNKTHLYEGLPLLSKEDFYAWAKVDAEFLRLYEHWKRLDYPAFLSPSIDRINPKDGYILSNMRWTTHQENSRLGAVSRWSR